MPCPCGRDFNDCDWPGRLTTSGLKVGQIVVTEGAQRDFISAAIRWATGSRLTHCFIVTGRDEMIEAYVPRVRVSVLSERLAELETQDRAYYVLEAKLTISERCKLVNRARQYLGRFYDIGQALLFCLFRKFSNDGTGTLICSRLVSGLFAEALAVNLFDDTSKLDHDNPRLEQITRGECLPSDLLKSTRFTLVKFSPSSRITTP